MRLVDSDQMRNMDLNTIQKIGVPSLVLMENAARSWVEATRDILEKARKIFVLCGAGNNGGDGYAIARIVRNQGLDCAVVMVKQPKSEDCLKNADIWDHYGQTIDWTTFISNASNISPEDVLIDAILGTGIETPLRGDLPERLNQINALPAHRLAVDLPSGISANTGDFLGGAIQAERTVTFQMEKVGHHLYPGKSYAGKTVCQKISIQEVFKESDQPYYLVNKASAQTLLPKRAPIAYKNTFGHVAILCGTSGTMGAAALASHAAIKTGVGLVTVSLPENEQSAFLSKAPELMTDSRNNLSVDWINRFDALVVGCGLGRDQMIWGKIEKMLNQVKLPVLFDADAFYGISNWRSMNLERAVLTPHAGEFARLSGYDKPRTNRERIDQGLAFIEQYPTTLVLKGAPTIIFSKTSELFINDSGNAGMATAGSGDVLAGIIGGFLGQGMKPIDAAKLGTWLHGKSGDLYATAYNQETLTASNLIDYLKDAVSDLRQ